MKKVHLLLCMLTCSLLPVVTMAQPEKKDGYYQLQNAEDLAWFAQFVNSSNLSAQAQLTADIDFSEQNTMIGMNGDFAGTLDGQGHKITVKLERSEEAAALFRAIASNGVVKNLHVDGSIHTSAKCAAGIVAYLHGTIENCWSSVQINSDVNGDGTHAGIAAEGFSGFVIRNTLSTAQITGGQTTNCGGLVGWMDGGGTFTNNLSLTVMELASESGSDTFARNNGNMTGSGNYYVAPFGDLKEDVTTRIDQEQLKSGEVCFLLNGDQTNIIWRQNLNDETFPTPMPGSSQVYAVGKLKCDGSFGQGTTFQNTPGNEVPDHKYSNGYCTVCGQEQPDYASLSDGKYLIETPEQLIWFANKVNNGENGLSALLVSDINMNLTDEKLSAMGADGNRYKGTFDGGGHTLTVNIGTDNHVPSLFAYTTSGAEIVNLTVDGRIETESLKFASGLVAHGCGGTLENCVSKVNIVSHVSGDGTHAGLIGIVENPVTIRNCMFAGSITGENTDNCAGLVGWASAKVTFENCLQIGDIEVGANGSNTYCRNSGNGVYTNCYYLTHFNDTPSDCQAITNEDLASGKVAYLLNNSNMHTQKWFQTLGEDAYPVPNSGHGLVVPVAEDQYLSWKDWNSSDAYFAEFKLALMNAENEYVENLIATNTLRDQYMDILSQLDNVSDPNEFLDYYEQADEVKQQLRQSAQAYAQYQETIDYVRNYLAEDQSFVGEERMFLTSYLEDVVEPGEDYKNGSYLYITDEENLLLSADEIKAESQYVLDLLAEAISKGYGAGSDITRLLTNADFQNGFDGWQGVTGTGYGTNGTISAGESWNQNTDMYQQLTGLTNGVYMLSVNAAYRPYTDPSSNMYGGMIYANDNYNYVQSDREGMISLADAQDKVNCYLPGNVGKTDLEVYDADGTLIGYALHSLPSCYYAFQASRCPNYILANVTDGTLKVGLLDRGSGCGNDWMGFGNIHLTFCGSLETATDALDQTLAGMLDRAVTILNFEFRVDEEYAHYPNFSQALRDQLTSLVQSAQSASDNQEKYQLICQLSIVFQEIHSSRLAYANMARLAESVNGAVSMLQGTTISDDQANSLRQSCQLIWDAYQSGSYSTEEAESASALTDTGLFPTQKGGIYQIGNNTQMAFFSVLVNNGSTSAKACLTNDISNFTQAMIMQQYAGDFDGAGHTINLNITNDKEYSCLFANLLEGAVVHDLRLTGQITTSAKFGSSVAGQIFKATARNIESYVQINSTVNGDGTHAGIFAIVQTGATLENCLFAGSIQGGSATNCCAGLVGWLSGPTTFDNCLMIADMQVSASGSSTFARNANGNATLSNCYYNTLFGEIESNAILVTQEQLESGEVCYNLNLGNTEDPIWRQTIGQDTHPVLTASHGIVVQKSEGLYGNLTDDIQQISQSKNYNAETYTLSGIRVTRPQTGIYIRGGHKYIQQ